MKKIYSLLLLAFIGIRFAFAGGGCLVDFTNTKFLSPDPDSLSCITRGVPYSQSFQIHIPDSIDLINYGASFSFVLYIDSVVFNGIDGLPVGISDTVYPAAGVFYPGEYGCVRMSGTTNDTAGHYFLIPNGTITAHGTPYLPAFDGDTTVTLANLQRMALGDLDLYVDVIPQGALCRNQGPPPVCIPDSSNTSFFSPRPDSLPCVERTIAYSEVIQIAVPRTINLQDFGSPFPFILFVDSVVITAVHGLPNGITYKSNPANGKIYGGGYGCALVSGITTDPPGRYPISFDGTFTARGTPFPPYFDGDTTLDFATLQGLSQGRFNLYLDVINPGDPCVHTTGIADYKNSLNAIIYLYPNPSNGVVQLKLNSGGRVKGEIAIVDMTGRKVFAQPVDAMGLYSTTINLSQFAKGIYTVQIKTAEGFASKNISIE